MIVCFLHKDPKQRLGFNGVNEVKLHPWFSDFDWDLLLERKVPPLATRLRTLKRRML